MSQPKAAPAEQLLPGLGLEIELGVLVIGGAVLLALLIGMSRLVSLLPMHRERRVLLERGLPVLGMLLVLPYLLFAARIALQHSGRLQSAALAALAAAGLVAAWFAVRDWVAGVIIKAGRTCAVGDQIRIGELQGRVVRMGIRTLALETRTGDEALVPYTELSRRTVVRTPVLEGFSPHVFHIRTGDTVSVSDARQAILESAMCAYWASVVREPQIQPIGRNTYEVTVFALNPDYGLDIERSVLAATKYERSLGLSHD